MKTEDIDKRIGMPDVDAEWAKFEREVIDKEAASHKSVMLWGLSIAASIALVAGIFLFGRNADEQAETLVAESELPVIPSIQETVKTVPETESGTAPETATDTKIASKTEQQANTDLLATTTPTETKKEEMPSSNPATDEPDKTFGVVEESPQYPGGQKALKEFLKANKRYDGLAQEYGAKGRVITSFLIDSLGNVSDIKAPKCLLKYDTLRLNRETQEVQQQVKQQITTQLSEESIRLVRLMPRWIPGKMNGKPRNVRFILPVQFP
jgi:hypothetical protein